jgi:hypothetical protein
MLRFESVTAVPLWNRTAGQGYGHWFPVGTALTDVVLHRAQAKARANVPAFLHWRSWLRGVDLSRRPLGYDSDSHGQFLLDSHRTVDVQIRSWDRLAQSMKRVLPTMNQAAVYFP